MSTIPTGTLAPAPIPSASSPSQNLSTESGSSQRADPWAALRRDLDPTDGLFEVRDLQAADDIGLTLRDAINNAVDAVGNMLRAFGMEPVRFPKLGEQLGASLFQDLSGRLSGSSGYVAIEQSTQVTLDVRDLQIFQTNGEQEASFRYTSVSLSIQSQTTVVAGGTTFPSFLDLTGKGFGDLLPERSSDPNTPLLALKDIGENTSGDSALPDSLTLDAFAPLLAQAGGRTLVPSSLFSTLSNSGLGRFEVSA